MNDMTSTIVAKSDQINAADLIGSPRTITIKEVRIKSGDDQPVSVLIEGDRKAFRPCLGVRRLMTRVWGADASKYIGESMTLFRDPTVTWAGKEEGGIRVSHMSGLDEEIIEYMRISRAATKPYRIKPLVVSQPVSELTIEGAELELAAASTMDELRTVWSRKSMAPFRKQLQSVLDERKAALSKVAANDLLQRLKGAQDMDDVHGIAQDFDAAQFDEDTAAAIQGEIDAAKGKFSRGEG